MRNIGYSLETTIYSFSLNFAWFSNDHIGMSPKILLYTSVLKNTWMTTFKHCAGLIYAIISLSFFIDLLYGMRM